MLAHRQTPAVPEEKPREGDLDFGKFLLGTWKRNLECHEFQGKYALLSAHNIVALVEEFSRGDAENGVRYLKWSFGKTFQRSDLRQVYDMKVVAKPGSKEVQLEWQFQGFPCKGVYYHHNRVAVLNFVTPTTLVTVTYRVLDASTMAVCVVEVVDGQPPTVQFGSMYRIDPENYLATANSAASL
eukprot:TRINITY_DN97643_c0_g1_i1.p2 TRINITY_DN97643_c0_g1~~TRINITY_DN97643_c0_g1_i1.p2  ORF type:complete len:184 (+),score=45.31 TRINITY_DN97643_c0_g1_i1:97-648(+)